MSIMWKYLDKRNATIAAIKDYSAMEFIIQNTDSEIKAEQEKMVGVASPNWDGMPHVHNPNAAEDRILRGIEEIDILKERYRQALEYMNWFKPAWDQLSEDDQMVLDLFFKEENRYGDYAIDTVMNHFKIERSSAYRKKDRAIDRLTILLFGRA